MKKAFQILGIILLALLLLAAVILVHAGLFEPVVTMEKKIDPYTLVYQDHIGSYYKVKPAMDEVYHGLLRLGIETYRGAGVYYDDPQKVRADKLRSEIGSILEEKDLDKVDKIKNSFKVKEIPASKSIVVEFPIRNMLSYMIGPAKVYKEVNMLWQQQSYPEYKYAVEIYDVPNKTITYIMPINEIIVDKIIVDEPIIVPSLKPEEATEEATEEAEIVDEKEILETVIRDAIIEKRGGDPDNLIIIVSKIEGDYSSGGVRNASAEVGGAMWLAAKVDGVWELVWDGNGAIYCNDLIDYLDFPASMIPECYDEVTGEVVLR